MIIFDQKISQDIPAVSQIVSPFIATAGDWGALLVPDNLQALAQLALAQLALALAQDLVVAPASEGYPAPEICERHWLFLWISTKY